MLVRVCVVSGAVFIVWDYVFGTYAAERKGEKIYYSVVHRGLVKSFNPVRLQVGWQYTSTVLY